MSFDTVREPPLCKHWARHKSCLYHSKGKCKFSHPEDYVLPAPKQDNRHHRSSQQTNLHNRHRTSGGRLLTRNDARVAILRAFIAAPHTCGDKTVQLDLAKFNVLDVAGGKGELAFQLLNLNNVQTCHVIDPRPLSLGKFQKRLSKGFYHRSRGILQHDVVREQTDPERPVDQLRCMFSSELWEEPQIESSSNKDGFEKQRNEFFKNCYKAQGWVWPPKGVDEHAAHQKFYTKKGEDDNDDDDDDNNDAVDVGKCHQEIFSSLTPSLPPSSVPGAAMTTSNDSPSDQGSDFTPSFEHASQVVKKADLIVGMHPDQAVDAIIDAALALDISFFVVPCCVYSKEFPLRRLRGKHVRTYEELICYLQAKSTDIQRHSLPFEGRNICLYRVVT